MEGEFSKVSFLEQVGTWEPFAVESGLEVTCKLSLLKVIVLHSILLKFQMLIIYNFKNFMAPFYGWGSTASRLEPLRGGSLLFTIQFLEIPGTHFIDLGRMKGSVNLGATQWFWAWDPWIANPAPYSLGHSFTMAFSSLNPLVTKLYGKNHFAKSG